MIIVTTVNHLCSTKLYQKMISKITHSEFSIRKLRIKDVFGKKKWI